MNNISPVRWSWRYTPWNVRLHDFLLACLVFVLCLCASVLGGLLEIPVPQPAWLLWPGCATLVAVLALVPRNQWPIVITAGLAGFVVYDHNAGLAVGSIVLLVFVDALEVLTAAFLLRLAFDGELQLDTVNGLAKYFLVGLIAVPIATATISAAVLREHSWLSWRVTFFSEALAFLLLPPAILSWAKRLRNWSQESVAYWVEVCVLMLGVTLVAYVISLPSGHELEPILLYALVPLLIWSALRFLLLGVSTSIIIFAFISIWGSIHGQGPFGAPTPLERALSLQLFLFCAAIPFTVLAALAAEHKRSSVALRESESRFRLIADRAPVMIWMSEINKNFTFFNKTWLNFTGQSMLEQSERGWIAGMHPDDCGHYLKAFSDAFDAKQEFAIEYRLRRFDGDYRWLEDHGVPRFESNGAFCGYIGACRDITDRRLYESSLEDLNGRLIMAQEQERTKIARELHDDLSQRMARLLIRLERCLQSADPTSPELHKQLTSTLEMASDISAALRDLSHLLHPGTLAALGLEASVAALCQEFSEQYNLTVEFVHHDVPQHNSPDVNLCLFRIVQEALLNIVKHSGACEARVTLIGFEQEINLSIEDSGIGFNSKNHQRTDTLGLVSMRERVRLVDGELSIQSEPAKGTRVDVQVPCKSHVND